MREEIIFITYWSHLYGTFHFSTQILINELEDMSNIIVSSGMNVSAKKSELWLEEWGVRTWGVRTSSLTSSSRPLSLYTSPVVWWPRTVSTSHGTPHTADEKARHKRRNFGGLKAMKDSNFWYWYYKQYENIEVRKLPLTSARQFRWN